MHLELKMGDCIKMCYRKIAKQCLRQKKKNLTIAKYPKIFWRKSKYCDHNSCKCCHLDMQRSEKNY